MAYWSLRCLLGWHAPHYLGEHSEWPQPWLQVGWNHVCDRCGARSWAPGPDDPHFVVGGGA